LAARSRRKKLDTGARRHHRLAVGITRESESTVREREHYSAVTHAKAIDHVGTHGHGDLDSAASGVDDFDTERLRSTVGEGQRVNQRTGAVHRVVRLRDGLA